MERKRKRVKQSRRRKEGKSVKISQGEMDWRRKQVELKGLDGT